MLRRAVIALCLVQDPIHSPYAKKLMVKLRYFFFGLFVLLGATPYLLPGYVASHPSYISLSSISLSVITIILLILVLYFIGYVERNTRGDPPLTRREKFFVIVTELLLPLIAAGFYYYCWKRRFPTKAWQANKYQWVIFGIGVILFFGSSLIKS